jgi:hypothetical protein
MTLISAWLALFARTVRLYAEKLSPAPQPPPQRPTGNPSCLAGIYLAVSGIDALLPFTALAFWWFDALPLLPFWLLIYSAADAIHAHTRTLMLTRRI